MITFSVDIPTRTAEVWGCEGDSLESVFAISTVFTVYAHIAYTDGSGRVAEKVYTRAKGGLVWYVNPLTFRVEHRLCYTWNLVAQLPQINGVITQTSVIDIEVPADNVVLDIWTIAKAINSQIPKQLTSIELATLVRSSARFGIPLTKDALEKIAELLDNQVNNNQVVKSDPTTTKPKLPSF